MSWKAQFENCLVYFGMPLVIYLFTGAMFRSVHSTGLLNWQGRRWRTGVTLGLLLFGAWFEISELRYGAGVLPDFAAVGLDIGLGLLFLLLIRWWWRDARKEKTAYESFVQRLHEEGREYPVLPTNRRTTLWRWVVNAYAIFLVAALIYGVTHYLLTKV